MTEQENVALIREFYRRFLSDDIDGMLDMNAEGVVWEIGSGPAVAVVPYFGIFRGRQGILDCLAKYNEAADVQVFEMEEYYGDKNRVFVLGHEKVTAKATGKQFELKVIFIYTLRDSKIVKMSGMFDTAAMIQAFRP